MTFLADFSRFARRGNLVDLAVGFTVGAAFSTIAKSLVNDVLMPPVGLLLGRTDFSDFFWIMKQGPKDPGPYLTLSDAQAAGAVTINYGVFINSLVAYAIVALAMFFVVRMVQRAEKRLEDMIDDPAEAPLDPTEKKCPYCRSTIAYRATRCPQCTSHLPADPSAPAPKNAVVSA